jgi:alpha 1,2-mannosyltransferase
MPLYELDKKYDYNQIAAASANFFLDDADFESFKRQQQTMMQAVPSWETVSWAYSGRGIVICAGAQALERVWPNTVLMLRSINSSLPIEVWTKDQEEYDRTLPLVDQMQAELGFTISVHTLSDYMSIVWRIFPLSEIFKVKALALLFSSFEEVILFDSDSIPVMDPIVLFDMEEAESGLIQWPVSSALH